jgi:hypothetical protein
MYVSPKVNRHTRPTVIDYLVTLNHVDLRSVFLLGDQDIHCKTVRTIDAPIPGNEKSQTSQASQTPRDPWEGT